MLTRLLHKCGLELGPESELMPPQADNPDGFWENLRFVAINDEVLNELGAAWDLPPTISANFKDPSLEPMRIKARTLIAEFDSHKRWGWKDPRNSLTLPFWHDLLPGLQLVIIVRNPLEAAYSMRKRNGTSYAFALRLWEIYNRRLIGATKNIPYLITHYDSFFDNPEKELERLTAFIGLPASATGDAVALVASKRRHTHFTFDQMIDARVSSEIIELYSRLLSAAGRLPEGIPAVHQKVSSKIGDNKSEHALPGAINRLRLVVPEGESIRQANLELDKLRQDLQGSAEELARRDGQIRELRIQSTQQEQARARLQEELQQAREVQARLQEELLQAREHLAQTNHLLHEKSVNVAIHEARITELTTDLRRQLQATRKLSRLLDDLESAAARLRSSRRWKMANPVMALKSKLSSQHHLLGYGHLEKIVAAYSKWRGTHPEVARIDDAIQALVSRAVAPVTPPVASDGERTLTFGPTVPTEPIQFTIPDKIEISIIIPVFNQLPFTQACLGSIQKHQGKERFEVIVVDDSSTDATAEVIPKLPGIVYLRNERNLGFVASCNRGAAKARGDYLVFLNNDTTVTAGWLSALRETFQIDPKAGLVGSKLVFPDGRLQEAGGIIWRDGSGWNRGKFQDPAKPEYNYLRDVDYCSAACIMISKSVFESIGGFDAKYEPAYYEDVDLAFKLRRAGFKTLYQPVSQVVHYEGATGGTDVSTGTKKYQSINRTKFVEAWAEVLAAKPANGDVTSYEKLALGQKRVLVVDHHLPMPERDAGSLRMFQILVILRELGHRVIFIPDNLADIPPYTAELQKRGVQVIHHPYIKSVRAYLEAHGADLDIIILSRCDFARKHIVDVRTHAPQSRIIFDTVDLHFLRQDREAKLTQDPEIKRRAAQQQQEEYALINQADETWVVSNFEQELLHKALPDKSIEVVSMIVDVPGSATPFPLRNDFLFIGGFQHKPNIDAVLFFARDILPIVQARLPDAKFYIIGDKAPPAVVALASENIIVTGLQPNVRPFFDSVKLSVAPLRYGAGVKGKINQSMAFGVPVVATSLAIEGMGLVDGEDIVVADSPEAFAQAVIELYTSEQLWTSLSQNGLAKTEQLYSVEAARRRLEHLLGSEQRLQPKPKSILESQLAVEPVAKRRQVHSRAGL